MRRETTVKLWRWRLREILEEKGLTVREVARQAGVSRSTVQAFCRDPQHNTTSGMWARLARASGVPLAEMIERVPENEKQTKEHD